MNRDENWERYATIYGFMRRRGVPSDILLGYVAPAILKRETIVRSALLNRTRHLLLERDEARGTQLLGELARLLREHRRDAANSSAMVLSKDLVTTLLESLENERRMRFSAEIIGHVVKMGDDYDLRLIVDNGVIFDRLCNSLKLSDDDAFNAGASISAMAELAARSRRLCTMVLKQGGLGLTLRRLDIELKKDKFQRSQSLLRKGALTVATFCRRKPNYQLFLRPALPTLRKLLLETTTSEDDVMTDCYYLETHMRTASYVCEAFSALCDGQDEHVQDVLHLEGVLKRIIDLLSHSASIVALPSLTACGNACAGADRFVDILLEENILGKLNILLTRLNPEIRKGACWVLSNILSGTTAQVQAVLDYGFDFSQVLNDQDPEVKQEAACALSNAIVAGAPAQIAAFVHIGAIGPLCDLLNVNSMPLVTNTLEALNGLLNALVASPTPALLYKLALDISSRGLHHLERLADHPRSDVSDLARNSLATFAAMTTLASVLLIQQSEDRLR